MLRNTLLAAMLLALSACAAQQGATDTAAATPAAGRDCFRNDDVHGYGVIDDHNVNVRVGQREYIMTTLWNARNLDWNLAIAIRSPTGWICTGNGLGVELIGGTPPRTYPVSSITRAPEPPPAEGS